MRLGRWLLPGVAALWALMRGLGLDVDFPFVQLVAFTPYATVAAVLVALVALARRQWAPGVLSVVSAAVLIAAVAPRATADDGAPQGRPLRVMTVNAFTGHASASALIAVARRERADVLSVQELTPRLAAALAPAFAHHLTRPGFNAVGTGLFSRFPLERGDPPRTTYRLTAATLRLPGGARVSLLAVHPLSPRVMQTSAWERDLRALPSAPASGAPAVLAGDFNATLDHRELRRVLARGYRDAAAQVGRGLTTSWPAGGLLPPPVTIDHVLVTRRVGVRSVQVRDVRGSDHRAVIATLVLTRAG